MMSMVFLSSIHVTVKTKNKKINHIELTFSIIKKNKKYTNFFLSKKSFQLYYLCNSIRHYE